MKIRTFAILLMLLALMATSVGCSYAGAAATQDGYVVVARNGLFGAVRKVFVCKVTPNGLASCAEAEAP